jgi:hypothetical protein
LSADVKWVGSVGSRRSAVAMGGPDAGYEKSRVGLRRLCMSNSQRLKEFRTT